MSLLVHALLLAVLLGCMGYLVSTPGPRRRRLAQARVFMHAVAIAAALIAIGVVAMLVTLVLYTSVVAAIAPDSGLFVGAIVIIVASGLLTFLAVRPLAQRLRITHERLGVVEYLIQWTLIYVTVYQVAFVELADLGDTLDDDELERGVDEMLRTVIDPSLLVVLLLPVLIAVWVATAMLKLRIENQTRTDLDQAVIGG